MFEHPGRSTMGASIFAAKRGGTVVTCAATSGYMVEFDNRHFWMKLKRLDRLPLRQLRRGVRRQPADRPGPHPPDAAGTYALDQVGEAALAVHRNEAEGKLGVLCLAPAEGLGIDDPEKRDRVGEANITRFRPPDRVPEIGARRARRLGSNFGPLTAYRLVGTVATCPAITPNLWFDQKAARGGRVLRVDLPELEHHERHALHRGRPRRARHRADRRLRTRRAAVHRNQRWSGVHVRRSDLAADRLRRPGRGRLLLGQADRRRRGEPVRLAEGSIRVVVAGRAGRDGGTLRRS